MNKSKNKEELKKEILEMAAMLAQANVSIDDFDFTNQEKRFIKELIAKYTK